MIKPAVLSIAAATVLAACGTSGKEDAPMVGMSNPASEFCVKQGGKLEMKKDKDGGEYALCHLPDGTVVEEWEYSQTKQKISNKACSKDKQPDITFLRCRLIFAHTFSIGFNSGEYGGSGRMICPALCAISRSTAIL